jgi:hypothetical protein
MTETDWLAARDPDRMLTAVADRMSARRWRLLAGTFADRATAGYPLSASAACAATCVRRLPAGPALLAVVREHARQAARPGRGEGAVGRADRRALGCLLHELVGNPFRPVRLRPEWRTPVVLAVAAGIEWDGGFDRLPLLADALEDAGCDSPALLHHLRGQAGPAYHVPGCWALDLVLAHERGDRPPLRHRGERRPLGVGG